MSPIVLIGGGVVILVLLIVGVVISINSEQSLVEERLGSFLDDQKQDGSAGEEASRSIVTDWMNRRVASSSSGDRVARELARADIKFKVVEYYALVFMSTVGVAIIAFLLQRFIASPIIGGIVGFFIPRFYVKRQQAIRLNKFNDQLADMLNLVVNGLRAGYSVMQALEAVSRELPSPISDEFRRVVQEMQIGISMEKALENLLRRIPSEDLDFVVTAINVQREVGGNLAEILDTISFTIRERVRIKGEIRIMTAQVRTSGAVLSFIPIFLAVALYFVSPEYIKTFFNASPATPQPLCGIIAVATIVGMIAAGYFVMQKIADIEV
ncbi:MAG: type II secretion system F family protein [Chloroflexota bacterium]